MSRTPTVVDLWEWRGTEGYQCLCCDTQLYPYVGQTLADLFQTMTIHTAIQHHDRLARPPH